MACRAEIFWKNDNETFGFTLKMPPGFEMPGVLGPVLESGWGQWRALGLLLTHSSAVSSKQSVSLSFLLNGSPWPDFQISLIHHQWPLTQRPFIPLRWALVPSSLRTQLRVLLHKAFPRLLHYHHARALGHSWFHCHPDYVAALLETLQLHSLPSR